jgi:hypothetical protein
MLSIPPSRLIATLILGSGLLMSNPMTATHGGAAEISSQARPVSLKFAFAENAKTFLSVAGNQVRFTGSCPWENARIVLTGAVQADATTHKGHWETVPVPLEPLCKGGPVEISATAIAANDGNATASPKLNVVNLLQEGAAGNGTTDDLSAIKAAVKKAHPPENGLLYAPAGHTFAHSDLIELDGVELLGGGDTSAFVATNPLRSAIVLKGDAPGCAGFRWNPSSAMPSANPPRTPLPRGSMKRRIFGWITLR